MKLRGIEFGPVIGTSRLGSSLEDESAFRLLARAVTPGATFSGMTRTTGTVTLDMALKTKGFRKTVVERGAGVMLQADSSANPGLATLLAWGVWQKLSQPFFISLALVGATRDARLEECRIAVGLFKEAMPRFRAPFALQLSLPSITEEESERLSDEFGAVLQVAAELGVPLVCEIPLACSPDSAANILRDANCDALLLSDGIPWDALPEQARDVFFRTQVSPLARYGGGTVFGKYILPLSVEWLTQLRRLGVGKPVIAGGVLRPRDVAQLHEAGASAVSLGAVAALRPWNMRRVIRRARALFS